jgi:O-acetylhomoserine/O-acetylserine sulfhydrylase-like pyridoxal-dependent enzyme
MERHSSNAHKLAEFIEKHPKVNWVLYPGLPSHPGHAIAKKQMKLFGGLVAFEVKGGVKGASSFVTVRIFPLYRKVNFSADFSSCFKFTEPESGQLDGSYLRYQNVRQ